MIRAETTSGDLSALARTRHVIASERRRSNTPSVTSRTCHDNNNNNNRASFARKPKRLTTCSGCYLPVDINMKNLFVKYELFFRDSESDQKVVMHLLDDVITRGIKTIDEVADDLVEYCQHFRKLANNNCRSFLRAAMATVLWCYYDNVCAELFEKHMRELLAHRPNSLRKLLTLVCSSELSAHALFIDAFRDAFRFPSDVTVIEAQQVLAKMDVFLEMCTHLHIEFCDGVKFIDMKLTFGETPLVMASRAQRPDTVATLLRHGANIDVTWLSYKNCLEVLLFSATIKHYDDLQLRNIELCVPIIARHKQHIDIDRMRMLSHEYYPVTSEWESLLRKYVDLDRPVQLQQLCKLKIRRILNEKWLLPRGVLTLPLPRVLRADVAIVPVHSIP